MAHPPRGHTLHVLQGVARIAIRDGRRIEAHAGQTIWCPPGEDHWHGATPDSFMEHLAINDTGGDLTTTTWGDHVTDQEYGN